MALTQAELEQVRAYLITVGTDVTNLQEYTSILDLITIPAVNTATGAVVTVPMTKLFDTIDEQITLDNEAQLKALKAAAGAAKAMKDLRDALQSFATTQTAADALIADIGQAIIDNLSPIAANLYLAQVEQTSTTASIDPNVLNVWGAVSTLSITFNTGQSGRLNEYMIQFTCPSNAATALTLPSSVIWLEEPEFEAGWTYQISVVNNLAIYAGWEPAAS